MLYNNKNNYILYKYSNVVVALPNMCSISNDTQFNIF